MNDYNKPIDEAFEKYGDCRVIFDDMLHGICTFMGFNQMKTLALCVVIDPLPSDYHVQHKQYKVCDLPFTEILVYNPDNELVERYSYDG